MGTIIVGGGLVIVVGLVILSMVRRYRQGKSILCDGVDCNACGSNATCQAGCMPSNRTVGEEKTVRFFKRVP